MATVRDLIKGSLRLIGAISTGETPAADEMQDALSVLNDMTDSWSTENLIIISKAIETFNLVGGQQTYTMGVGGNFATSRPQKIEYAAVKDVGLSTPSEFPLSLLTVDEWSNIPTKSLSGGLPTKLYCDYANPLSNLILWPAPSVSKQIVITSWKPLTRFATIGALVDFPPGYAKALRYNLAIELCPEYGKSASPEVIQGAMEAKENIKRMNNKPLYITCDEGATGGRKGFNYITGE